MRNLRIFIFLAFVISMTSCLKDKCTSYSTYDAYIPVYVTPEEYRVPVKLEEPRLLKETGKIYYYKNYLFINEVRKGVHVIDNSVPSAPSPLGFIPIFGNVDISIMNNKLYADAYTDLLIIDISNINDINLVSRAEDVLKGHYFVHQDNRILSHYEITTQTETLDCSSQYYGNEWYTKGDLVFFDSKFRNQFNAAGAGGAPSIIGQAGSMARFIITSGHLYILGGSELYAMQIGSNGNLSNAIKTELPWGVETLFPYGKNLFVGASDGMHILDITDPLRPVVKSTFTHARACDPVVVDDDIAYVTLRNGTECDGFINQLEIIDVQNIMQPKLLYKYDMQHPHGLAIADDYLYLCEGKYGLKVFNKSALDKLSSNLVFHDANIHAWDAIALNSNVLLVIGEGGFFQYDISDPKTMKLISSILVQK